MRAKCFRSNPLHSLKNVIAEKSRFHLTTAATSTAQETQTKKIFPRFVRAASLIKYLRIVLRFRVGTWVHVMVDYHMFFKWYSDVKSPSTILYLVIHAVIGHKFVYYTRYTVLRSIDIASRWIFGLLSHSSTMSQAITSFIRPSICSLFYIYFMWFRKESKYLLMYGVRIRGTWKRTKKKPLNAVRKLHKKLCCWWRRLWHLFRYSYESRPHRTWVTYK